MAVEVYWKKLHENTSDPCAFLLNKVPRIWRRFLCEKLKFVQSGCCVSMSLMSKSSFGVKRTVNSDSTC